MVLGIKCDRPECDEPATHVVICHQIDHCKETPSGTKSFMFCKNCTKGICDTIAKHVQDMKDNVAQRNEKLMCSGCQMIIERLSQVLAVEHLAEDSVMAGE